MKGKTILRNLEGGASLRGGRNLGSLWIVLTVLVVLGSAQLSSAALSLNVSLDKDSYTSGEIINSHNILLNSSLCDVASQNVTVINEYWNSTGVLSSQSCVTDASCSCNTSLDSSGLPVGGGYSVFGYVAGIVSVNDTETFDIAESSGKLNVNVSTKLEGVGDTDIFYLGEYLVVEVTVTDEDNLKVRNAVVSCSVGTETISSVTTTAGTALSELYLDKNRFTEGKNYTVYCEVDVYNGATASNPHGSGELEGVGNSTKKFMVLPYIEYVYPQGSDGFEVVSSSNGAGQISRVEVVGKSNYDRADYNPQFSVDYDYVSWLESCSGSEPGASYRIVDKDGVERTWQTSGVGTLPNGSFDYIREIRLPFGISSAKWRWVTRVQVNQRASSDDSGSGIGYLWRSQCFDVSKAIEYPVTRFKVVGPDSGIYRGGHVIFEVVRNVGSDIDYIVEAYLIRASDGSVVHSYDSYRTSDSVGMYIENMAFEIPLETSSGLPLTEGTYYVRGYTKVLDDTGTVFESVSWRTDDFDVGSAFNVRSISVMDENCSRLQSTFRKHERFGYYVEYTLGDGFSGPAVLDVSLDRVDSAGNVISKSTIEPSARVLRLKTGNNSLCVPIAIKEHPRADIGLTQLYPFEEISDGRYQLDVNWKFYNSEEDIGKSSALFEVDGSGNAGNRTPVIISGEAEDIYKTLEERRVEALEKQAGINPNAVSSEGVILTESISASGIESLDDSAFTINYSINVPVKAGFKAGDYEPMRFKYFFYSDSGRGACVDQFQGRGSDVEGDECSPLVAQVVGRANDTVSFSVQIKPALSAGEYLVIREFQVDPLGTWVSYGKEEIGTVRIGSDTSGRIPEAGVLVDHSVAKGKVLRPEEWDGEFPDLLPDSFSQNGQEGNDGFRSSRLSATQGISGSSGQDARVSEDGSMQTVTRVYLGSSKTLEGLGESDEFGSGIVKVHDITGKGGVSVGSLLVPDWTRSVGFIMFFVLVVIALLVGWRDGGIRGRTKGSKGSKRYAGGNDGLHEGDGERVIRVRRQF